MRHSPQVTGQTLHYGRLLCPLDDFASALQAFARSGVGCRRRARAGARLQCHRAVQVRRPSSWRPATPTGRGLARAANTLRFDADGWLADNTDGAGLVRDIDRQRRRRDPAAAGCCCWVPAVPRRVCSARCSMPGQRCCRSSTARPIGPTGSSNGTARWRSTAGVELIGGALESAGTGFDIVVNASASSLQAAAVPLPDQRAAPGCARPRHDVRRSRRWLHALGRTAWGGGA